MNSYSNNASKIAVVGCGGTGGWLCQLLGKTPNAYPDITLIDGDKIEKKNLDRQLFSRRQVGKNKASCIASNFLPDATVLPEFLELRDSSWPYKTLMQIPEPLAIFCCPDNHAARNACMEIADARDGETVVLITGNETTTGAADIYTKIWKDTDRDLRVQYPSIRTSLAGDPLSPAHCTDHDALEKDPQLALYNCLTAALALWLYESWKYTMSYGPAGEDSDLFSGILARMPVSVNVSANSLLATQYNGDCHD